MKLDNLTLNDVSELLEAIQCHLVALRKTRDSFCGVNPVWIRQVERRIECCMKLRQRLADMEAL